MRQQLDELRTLAINLFKAAEAEKLKHPKGTWGDGAPREFRDLPSESVDVWDAIAMEAYKQLRRKSK